ncbi:MAG: single-strand-binding protein/primosomal replication protein n [Rhodoferax sp.]
MQAFGNVATPWERKVSKTTSKGYWQGRLAESQRGIDSSPTFYTVRLMVDKDPGLKLGDFVRVTGKLKCDFYIGRDGKPTGSLLVIAFEATKISKHAAGQVETKDAEKEPEKAPAESQINAAPVQVPQPTVHEREPVRQPDPMQMTSSWADW